MKIRTQSVRWLALPLAAILLSACGGSDSTAGSSAASSPASSPAAASSSGSAASDASSTTANTDSAPSSAGSGAVNSDQKLFEMLPAEVQSSKTLEIATEALYPPYEYLDTDGTTVIGLDIELMDAATKKLGVTYTLTNTAFDGLLPGLESGRYQVVLAAVSDTKARQAKFDFVDYFQSGQAIVVPAGNPENIKGIADLCGKSVTVLVSSAQEALLNGFNTKECVDNKITITALPTDTDALLQVQSKRASASFTQEPVGRYNAAQISGGKAFEVANSETILPIPLGVVFLKKDTQLRDAFQAAYQAMIDDGTYKKILDARELGAGALEKITINAGTS